MFAAVAAIILVGVVATGCSGSGDPGRLLVVDEGDIFVTSAGEDAGFDSRVARADWLAGLAVRVDDRWSWRQATAWEGGFLVAASTDGRTQLLHVVDAEQPPTVVFESQFDFSVGVLPEDGRVVIHEQGETQRCHVAEGIEPPERIVRADQCGLLASADGFYAIDEAGTSATLDLLGLDGDVRVGNLALDHSPSRMVQAQGIVGVVLQVDADTTSFVAFDSATGDRVAEVEGQAITVPYGGGGGIDPGNVGAAIVVVVDNGRGAVELVAVDGDGSRTLAESAAGSAVVQEGGRTTLWIADSSTDEQSRVVELQDGESIDRFEGLVERVTVLEDGSGVLLWETDRDERVLWFLPADGDEAQQITILRDDVVRNWESPFGDDGPFVIATYGAEGGTGLRAVERDGTVIADLPANRWSELYVAAHVDDQLIVLGQEEPNDPMVLAILRLAGTDQQLRILDSGDDIGGSIHRAGSRLVYSVLDDGDWTIRSVALDGDDEPETLSRGGSLAAAETDLTDGRRNSRAMASLVWARTDTAAALCGAAGLAPDSEATIRVGPDGGGLGCLDVAGAGGDVLIQLDGVERGWVEILDADLRVLWADGPASTDPRLAAVTSASDIFAVNVYDEEPGTTISATLRQPFDQVLQWGSEPTVQFTVADEIASARSVYADDYVARITTAALTDDGTIELEFVAAGPTDLLGPWDSCLVAPSGNSRFPIDVGLRVDEAGRYEGSLSYDVSELGSYDFQYACRLYSTVPVFSVDVPNVAADTSGTDPAFVTAARRDADLIGIEVVAPGYDGFQVACLTAPDGRELPLVDVEPLGSDADGLSLAGQRFVFLGGSTGGRYLLDYRCVGAAVPVEVP